jgi:hypothetical protein
MSCGELRAQEKSTVNEMTRYSSVDGTAPFKAVQRNAPRADNRAQPDGLLLRAEFLRIALLYVRRGSFCLDLRNLARTFLSVRVLGCEGVS